MSRAARALGTLDAHSAHFGHPTALLGRPTTFAQTLGFRSLRVFRRWSFVLYLMYVVNTFVCSGGR